jgi:hypothetical protein
MVYEEGFSDIMIEDRIVDHHQMFMGEDKTAPISKADLLKFETTILAKNTRWCFGDKKYSLLVTAP